MIIPFPPHRIRRVITKEGQRITPLAFLLVPARLWVNYWSWWIDLALEIEDRHPTASRNREG